MSKIIEAQPVIDFITEGLNRKVDPLGYDAIEILGEIEFAQEIDIHRPAPSDWVALDRSNEPIPLTERWMCDNCKAEIRVNPCVVMPYNFCPYCGVQMIGVDVRNVQMQ